MKTRIILFFSSIFLLLHAIFVKSYTINFNEKTYQKYPNNPVLTNKVFDEMSQAYGFVMGQEYSLNLLKNKFPQLGKDILLVKTKFDMYFAPSIKMIDSILNKENSQWQKIKTNLNNQIRAVLNVDGIDYNDALSFIKSVEKRALGEMPVEIRGTLLTFNPIYISHPEQEYFDNYIFRYSSINNSKAKGLNFHIDFPMSWVAKEGNRPNVVQKFVSQNGHGFALAIILVNNLDGITNVSESDVKELLNPQYLKKLLPKNSRLISSGFISIDNLPGIFQEYKDYNQQLDDKIILHTISYDLFYKNKKISLQFSVGSSADRENEIDKLFSTYDALFKLIARNFVLKTQWK